jgi:hypothetical protein
LTDEEKAVLVSLTLPKVASAGVARGPVSEAVLRLLEGSADDAHEADHVLPAIAAEVLAGASSITRDDDIQLALFMLYASHYGSLETLNPELEWHPSLIATRVMLERAFERELRNHVTLPELPASNAAEVAKALFELAAAETGPSLARYFAKRATRTQALELLKQRSIYTLREADGHSWAIPRLTGRPKAALVEIQSDEYGGGDPERVHQELYAAAMRSAGLSDVYGTYVHEAPAITLASFNLISMLGLSRRLVGASVGHLAAFEMTSSIPSRFYSEGFRRLGFDDEVQAYFDEHVEADAVHEQIAARDLAGTLAEDRPELLPDIMFGAAACLMVDGWMATHILQAWQREESSLREEGTE